MLRYIGGRLLATTPVLLGMTILVFAMTWLTPGDPVVAIIGEGAQGISQADKDLLRRQLGLDRPLVEQYFTYVKGIVTGDLGTSIRSRLPVTEEIAKRLPATAELAIAGLSLAVLFGVTLGVLAAIYRGTIVDFFSTVIALIGVSVPVFWSGFVLMMFFSLDRGWLPASGRGTWQHLVLPAFTIALSSSASIARITRSSMLEILGQDYIRTARAKGIVERKVIFRHALRNALLPIVTIIGLQLGGLLGGAVLTESVFAWPGVGRLVVDAINGKDMPLVQGSVITISVIYIFINLIVDISYAAINPRVRYG